MEIIKLTDALVWEKAQTPNLKLRESFDCEETSLNTFLAQYARQADDQNSARTWVSLDKSNAKISGYISLSNTSLEKEEAGKAQSVHQPHSGAINWEISN